MNRLIRLLVLGGVFWLMAGGVVLAEMVPMIYSRDDYSNRDFGALYPKVGPIGGHIMIPWYDETGSNEVFTEQAVKNKIEAGRKVRNFDGQMVDKPFYMTLQLYLINPVLPGPVNEQYKTYVRADDVELISASCGKIKIPKYGDANFKARYADKVRAISNYQTVYRGQSISLKDDPRLSGIALASGVDDEAAATKDWRGCNAASVWGTWQNLGIYKEWVRYQMEVWRQAFPQKDIFLQHSANGDTKTVAQWRDYSLTLSPAIGFKHNGMQPENSGYSSAISVTNNNLKLRGGQIQVMDSVSDMFNMTALAKTAMETTLDLAGRSGDEKKRIEFAYWSFLASLRANITFADFQDDWILPVNSSGQVDLGGGVAPLVKVGMDGFAPWPDLGTTGGLGFWKWYQENLGVSPRDAKHAWVVFRDSELRSDGSTVTRREGPFGQGNLYGHGLEQGLPAYAEVGCNVNPGLPNCDVADRSKGFSAKLSGNFEKYLRLLNPEATSVVRWDSGEMVYPSGLVADSGQMYTRQMRKLAAGQRMKLLADQRLVNQGKFGGNGLKLRIFFLNKGTDSFTVKYSKAGGGVGSRVVTKGTRPGVAGGGVNAVLMETMDLGDVDLSGEVEPSTVVGWHGPNIEIESGVGDDFFHMVWVEAAEGNVSSPTPTATPTAGSGGGQCGYCQGGVLRRPGDANCDGVVNLVDFGWWRDDYLHNQNATRSDFSCNGRVDILDYSMFRTAYLGGSTVTPTISPLPSVTLPPVAAGAYNIGSPTIKNLVYGSRDKGEPHFAFGDNLATPKFLVSWIENAGDPAVVYGANANYNVYGQIVDGAGNQLTDPFVISATATDEQHPYVSYSPSSKEFLVAWQRVPDSSQFQARCYDVLARRVSEDGVLLGQEIAVSDPSQPDCQWVPMVQYVPTSNKYFITWHDHRYRSGMGRPFDTEKEIFGQAVNMDGSLSGGNVLMTRMVAGDPVARMQQYSDLAFGDGKVLSVWSDDRENVLPQPYAHAHDRFDIWYQLVDGTNLNFVGSNVKLYGDGTASANASEKPNTDYNNVSQAFYVTFQDFTGNSVPTPGYAESSARVMLSRVGGQTVTVASSGQYPVPDIGCSKKANSDNCLVVWNQRNANFSYDARVAAFNQNLERKLIGGMSEANMGLTLGGDGVRIIYTNQNDGRFVVLFPKGGQLKIGFISETPAN